MTNNTQETNKIIFTHLVSFPVIKGIENIIEVYLEYAAKYYPPEKEDFFDKSGRYEFEFIKINSLWQNGSEIGSFDLSNGEVLHKNNNDVSAWIDEVYCKNEDLSNSLHDFLLIQKAKEFCY